MDLHRKRPRGRKTLVDRIAGCRVKIFPVVDSADQPRRQPVKDSATAARLSDCSLSIRCSNVYGDQRWPDALVCRKLRAMEGAEPAMKAAMHLSTAEPPVAAGLALQSLSEVGNVFTHMTDIDWPGLSVQHPPWPAGDAEGHQAATPSRNEPRPHGGRRRCSSAKAG